MKEAAPHGSGPRLGLLRVPAGKESKPTERIIGSTSSPTKLVHGGNIVGFFLTDALLSMMTSAAAICRLMSVI